jgi:hypothetical protein
LVLTLPASAQTLVSRPQAWNDSVRVVVIWNGGTGNAGMPAGWNPAIGELGKDTKDFVQKSLGLIKPANLKFYTGATPGWAATTFQTLRNDFGGKPPHVIVYINAGWEWDKNIYPPTHDPYGILTAAAAAGVGILAVGDDAAYDGKKFFPLTGPGGKGDPIQYLSPMAGTDPKEWPGIQRLWIALDRTADANLSDGGLLYGLKEDTLLFKDFKVGGRGQSDADAWAVDISKLDNYSLVGFQQGSATNAPLVGSTPDAPTTDPQYTALAALQTGTHRIVMLDYQPQYLANPIASQQVVYNSVYWASKAHEVLQIPTPVANPASGPYHPDSPIQLRVALANASLYKVYYTVDGTAPSAASTPYSGGVVAAGDKSFTLKAIAISQKPLDWLSSEVMTENYSVPPLTLSAFPGDGTRFLLDTTVALSANPADAEIFFTLDGSIPDRTKTAYVGPIRITRTTSLKAVAYKGIATPATGRWAYTRTIQKIPTPTANPRSGVIAYGQRIQLQVAIADTGRFAIHYTLDGSIPGPSSPVYGAGIVVESDKGFTLKAIAITRDASGWASSEVLSEIYTVTRLSLTANPGNGTAFMVDTTVALIANMAGAAIFFTLDGSDPDQTKTPYTGPIKITRTGTLRAIGYKGTMTPATGVWIYTRTILRVDLIGDQSFSVKERSPAGTLVGAANLLVPDSLAVKLMALGLPPEFRFESATRSIVVAPGSALKFSGKKIYQFKLAAESARINAYPDTATITVLIFPDPLPKIIYNLEHTRGAILATSATSNPMALENPVFLVDPARPELCYNCAQKGSEAYLASAQAGTALAGSGPLLLSIKVNTTFRYDIAFYDNAGNFINRAKGEVDPFSLSKLAKDKDGNRSVGLVWWPVSKQRQWVGSGAYIARGTLTTTGPLRSPEGEENAFEGVNRTVPVSFKFGYLRRP